MKTKQKSSMASSKRAKKSPAKRAPKSKKPVKRSKKLVPKTRTSAKTSHTGRVARGPIPVSAACVTEPKIAFSSYISEIVNGQGVERRVEGNNRGAVIATKSLPDGREHVEDLVFEDLSRPGMDGWPLM
jgi:hypothetical protein